MNTLIKQIKNKISNRKQYHHYKDMPDGLLIFFFMGSVFPASYLAYITSELYKPYIDAFNAVGFSWKALFVTVVMLLIASSAWFFGNIARRTGELLYTRWFK